MELSAKSGNFEEYSSRREAFKSAFSTQREGGMSAKTANTFEGLYRDG